MREDLLIWGTYILVFVAGLGMLVVNCSSFDLI